MYLLQEAVLLCTLLYSTGRRTIDLYLYFKPRMSRSKHKSSRDVAVTAKKLLYCIFSYCTSRLKMFSLFFVFFLMCYLCEKYYKPVRELYYTADCVGWTPRLNLLDL